MITREIWERDFLSKIKLIQEYDKSFTLEDICYTSKKEALIHERILKGVTRTTRKRMFNLDQSCKKGNYDKLEARLDSIIWKLGLTQKVYEKFISNPERRKLEEVIRTFNQLREKFEMFESINQYEKTSHPFCSPLFSNYEKIKDLINEFKVCYKQLSYHEGVISDCNNFFQYTSWLIEHGLRYEYSSRFVDKKTLKISMPNEKVNKRIFDSIKNELIHKKSKKAMREDEYQAERKKNVSNAAPTCIDNEKKFDELSFSYSCELRKVQNDFKITEAELIKKFNSIENSY